MKKDEGGKSRYRPADPKSLYLCTLVSGEHVIVACSADSPLTAVCASLHRPSNSIFPKGLEASSSNLRPT